MAKTSRRTWQKREAASASLFGARRQYGSGSGGREDQTCSDSNHPRLYLEHKMRASHAVLRVWDDAKKKAHRERKDPVVMLSEKGRPGQWLVVHTADLPAVVANYLAALELDAVSDILANAARYRGET